MLEKKSSGESVVADPGHCGTRFTAKDVDVAARLTLEPGQTLDPAEAIRIRKKIDMHILPLMCLLYMIQFMDKSTLNSAAILGIRKDNHLTAEQFALIYCCDILASNGNFFLFSTRFNLLSTVFYISYFIFSYPQNLALQRFPVGKWMSLNIFVWSIALATQAACKNFGSLFALRFIMGMCEGSVTAGFMIVTSMFYTRKEQNTRVGYWFLMNGSAIIISGLLTFGALRIKHTSLHPWQWFMIITGLITFVFAVLFWLFFPDSPTNAWFLTVQERQLAVERIKVNQTGVENKYFKKAQFIEALTDKKTWLFALYVAVVNIPNAFSNQLSITIKSFGFTPISTALLGCVVGIVEIISILVAVSLVEYFRDSRAYVAMLSSVPAFVGGMVILASGQNHKILHLLAIYVSVGQAAGFVVVLAWITSVTAGHTKRVTVNAIILAAYSFGNAAGPQMFLEKYAPRNRVPWSVVVTCVAVSPWILWWIRILLSNENKKRNIEASFRTGDGGDFAYFDDILEDGTSVKRKVDKAFLDLTDEENKDFRYVL